MKTICIIISVLVVVAAIYCWMKLRKWTITFDAPCITKDRQNPQSTKSPNNLPARDAKGRFVKRK